MLSFSQLFSELEQDSFSRLGMNKGDPATSRSPSRYLIHEAIPGGSTCIQRRVQIRHSIADVVDARSPLGKEFPNGAIRGEWGQQFDLGFTKGQRYDGGAIDGLSRVWCDPEDVSIETERGLQVGDGNAHVGNAGVVGQTSLHGS